MEGLNAEHRRAQEKARKGLGRRVRACRGSRGSMEGLKLGHSDGTLTSGSQPAIKNLFSEYKGFHSARVRYPSL